MRARDLLGCQVWLEPTDTAERVEHLFASAKDAGLGWARIFLMWPFIEPNPGAWNFHVFDLAFDAAARHDIRIKATLTANSGPWHVGTPSMLHSHTGFLSAAQREPMRAYIQTSVKRYAKHPALGQWILWNEPRVAFERTPEQLDHWQAWLREKFFDIRALNGRWRTGYQSFNDIPFPEDVPHPAHRGECWNSYGPFLADWQSRAAWLISELHWVKCALREVDPYTETCINPTEILGNQAESGTDLEAMGKEVDIMGASYHPAWHFTFASRDDFPALMTLGVRLQTFHPSISRVEVTEVQAGNTLNSSTHPNMVTPSELARFFLAGLAGGAASVTGWCLNVRRHDFEAGDWGLLDNNDQPSDRTHMLRRLHDLLEVAIQRTGCWQAYSPRAWVGIDAASQAVEWVEARTGAPVPGRLREDGAHGAALLASQLMRLGVPVTMARTYDLPTNAVEGDLILLSHLVAWDETIAKNLLAFIAAGGTLLIDATCGRKDLDASLYQPWPGKLTEELGLIATDLQTRSEGYDIELFGTPSGRTLLTRLALDLDTSADWKAWGELRFAKDGAPLVWERPYGRGRFVMFNGVLGPSLKHEGVSQTFRYILANLSQRIKRTVVPVSERTIAVPVQVERGELVVVLAPERLERRGKPVRLQVQGRSIVDLWTQETMTIGAGGELSLSAEEGIALLWLQ